MMRLSAFILLVSAAFAQETYDCHHAGSPIRVDGKLDEPAWQAAAWTSDFVDIEGPHKPAPRFRTRAKILWDDEYLYIGAVLEEPNVSATLTQHDSVIFHDNDFEVFLKPLRGSSGYYEFEINALNTSWDLFLNKPYREGGKADNSWDIPGMKTAVSIDGTLNDVRDTDRGWTVEIAFPWSAFRSRLPVARPAVGDEWRVNFSRVEWKTGSPKEDNWVWSPQGVINMHVPERWGYLRFRGASLLERYYETLEQLSEQPAGERWKHVSTPYFQTNEKLLNRFYPRFDGLGGAIVGVSLQQNLSLLAHAQPQMAVVFDINPGVTEAVVPWFGELMAESVTRREFIERLVCTHVTEEDLLKMVAPGYKAALTALAERMDVNDHARRVSAQKAFFEARVARDAPISGWLAALQEDLWSGDFFTDATLGGGWLSTEANYRMVRRYWMEGRIVGVTGDIGGTSVAKLAAWLLDRKLDVTGLYLSNIGASVEGHEPGSYFVKLYETLGRLPRKPGALVLTAHGGHLTAWARTFERAEWVYRTLEPVDSREVMQMVEIPLERITANPNVPPLEILRALPAIAPWIGKLQPGDSNSARAARVTLVEAGLLGVQ